MPGFYLMDSDGVVLLDKTGGDAWLGEELVPAVVLANIPIIYRGEPYVYQLTSELGEGATWEIVSGQFPQGIFMTPGGLVKGITYSDDYDDFKVIVKVTKLGVSLTGDVLGKLSSGSGGGLPDSEIRLSGDDPNVRDFRLVPENLSLAQGIKGSLQVEGTIFRSGVSEEYYTNIEDYTGSTDRYAMEGAGFRRVAGEDGEWDSPLIFKHLAHTNQEILIAGTLDYSAVEPYSWLLGIQSSTYGFFGLNLYKYSNKYYVEVYMANNPIGTPIIIAAGSHHQMAWTGKRLVFWKNEGAGWIVIHETEDMSLGNEFLQIRYNTQWKGTRFVHPYIAIREKITPISVNDLVLSLTTSNAEKWLQGERIWLKSNTPETFQLIAALSVEEARATVLVEELYIRPKDPRFRCNGSVIEGSLIEFESNGAGGVLTAGAGTIVGMSWLTPPADRSGGSYSTVLIRYVVEGQIATCNLRVVPELIVEEVEGGYYPTQEQGVWVNFKASIPDAKFQCLNYSLESGKHSVKIPFTPEDGDFGGKILEMVARADGQEVYFKVPVYPIFPIPKYQGVKPKKWLAILPDRRPVSIEFEGGGMEVSNTTIRPIRKIQIIYENLSILPHALDCSKRIEPIANFGGRYEPIRDPNQGVGLNTRKGGKVDTSNSCLGCQMFKQAVSRLDAFEKMVEGMQGQFTVIDYHTGEMLSPFRMTRYTNDHENYFIEQKRTIELYYPAK